VNERKKLQKASLGIQDSDDEDAGIDVCIYLFIYYFFIINDSI